MSIRTRRNFLGYAFAATIMGCGALLSPSDSTPPTDDGLGGTGEVDFRDDFDATVLTEGWVMVREDPAAYSLTARPGFLRILSQRGAVTEGAPVKNLFLRTLSGDFLLETRLQFDPRAARQFAGLAIYESDDNGVALGLGFASGPRGSLRSVFFVSIRGVAEGAQPLFRRFDETNVDDPTWIHLRLLRSGDQLVAGFSPDGLNYTDLGSITNPFPQTVRVGVGAANGDYEECGAVCDTPISADFDFFQATVPDGSHDPPPPTAELTRLMIEGPNAVDAGHTASYSAAAVFSDNQTADVTHQTVWMVAPPALAGIHQGILDARPSESDQHVTVVATYTPPSASGGGSGVTAAKVVRINGSGVSRELPRMCGLGLIVPLFAVGCLMLFVRRRLRD